MGEQMPSFVSLSTESEQNVNEDDTIGVWDVIDALNDMDDLTEVLYDTRTDISFIPSHKEFITYYVQHFNDYFDVKETNGVTMCSKKAIPLEPHIAFMVEIDSPLYTSEQVDAELTDRNIFAFGNIDKEIETRGILVRTGENTILMVNPQNTMRLFANTQALCNAFHGKFITARRHKNPLLYATDLGTHHPPTIDPLIYEVSGRANHLELRFVFQVDEQRNLNLRCLAGINTKDIVNNTIISMSYGVSYWFS